MSGDDAKHLYTVPAGGKIAVLSDGRWIAVHPDHPPQLISSDGVREIALSEAEVAELADVVMHGHVMVSQGGAVRFSRPDDPTSFDRRRP